MKQHLQLLLLVTLLSTTLQGGWYDDKGQMNGHFNHTKEKNYKNQRTEPLVIHVIPHSHDDVGWLSTLYDYYYGSVAQGDHAGVQYTLTTVVQSLILNPTRKFVEVEMGFFSIWWYQQTEEVKQATQKLVQRGQLHFINAGWSQNDEACTYYENIIDNMFVGHRFLLTEFGYVPSIGWSIDPFGHSSAQSALYSQMGFNGWWFARVDYQDKQKRLEQKAMEMVWNPEQASNKHHPIYASVNYRHYSAPFNFCFDTFCNDEPVKDNKNIPGYNLDKRSKELIDYFENMALHYKTNNLLHTFGEDFQYTNAEMYYSNIDKLIKYINENPEQFNNTSIKYSSPSEYLEEINAKNVTLPEQKYDFFPYADNYLSYWTGYFTSRVAGKGGTREGGKTLQIMRTYLALLKYDNLSEYCIRNQNIIEDALTTFEQGMGILQHHDAITGTAQQDVQNNYMWILSNITDYLHTQVSNVLNEQTQNLTNLVPNTDFFAYNWNETSANWELPYDYITKKKQNLVMTVYNPQLTKEDIIKFLVPNGNFDVVNLYNNEFIQCEVICPDQQDLSTNCQAFIKANLVGYNLNYFEIRSTESPQFTKILQGKKVSQNQGELYNILQQKNITLYPNSDKIIYDYCNKNNICYNEHFQVQYNMYQSYQGEGQKSGAYIFRPANNTFKNPINYSKFESKYVYIGDYLTLVHLEGNGTSTDLYFYNLNDQYDKVIPIETYVKSISIDDGEGKEIVIDIESDLKNQQIFYTDSSGLDALERKLNYRPTWELNVTQPASGNYYPVNAFIQIRDNETKKVMTLMNDRAQGGTSLKEGELELMINRRCLYDDGRGVGQALNETNRFNDEGLEQKIRHWLIFGRQDEDFQNDVRKVQFDQDLHPFIFFSGYNQIAKLPKISYSSRSITATLKPLTKLYLRYYGSESEEFLLRLQNFHQNGSTNFKQVFGTLTEVTLTANQPWESWKKNQLKWTTEPYNESKYHQKQVSNFRKLLQQHKLVQNQDQKEEELVTQQYVEYNFIIKPLEIRTFNITSFQ